MTNGTSLNAKEFEANTEKWSLNCQGKENNKSCVIAIYSSTKDSVTKKITVIGTAYIQKKSSKQQVMNLVDKSEGTYKLIEDEKFIPTLYMHLPFRSDLRKSPTIEIGQTLIGEMQFQYCSVAIGCKAALSLNEKVIDLFKKGKSLHVNFNGFGSNNMNRLAFPLKGFTKVYKNLR